MSATKKETSKEPKELTASQLFDRYMKAVGRANKLADKLKVEILEAERLSTELSERFGVHVGNKPLAHKTQPVTRKEPVRNKGDKKPPAGTDYKPPVQVHAEALRLSSKESQEVAEIRANAGLSPEQQEDAVQLEAEAGPGRLAKLQEAMGGVPAVVPSPGAVRQGSSESEPDNTEGGPVKQGPVPEEE